MHDNVSTSLGSCPRSFLPTESIFLSLKAKTPCRNTPWLMYYNTHRIAWFGRGPNRSLFSFIRRGSFEVVTVSLRMTGWSIHFESRVNSSTKLLVNLSQVVFTPLGRLTNNQHATEHLKQQWSHMTSSFTELSLSMKHRFFFQILFVQNPWRWFIGHSKLDTLCLYCAQYLFTFFCTELQDAINHNFKDLSQWRAGSMSKCVP